ncbi:MAG: oligosaccharide flippase family protein [Sedimentisphaerales bacterium]|nr:oligosaccharide flippase family protein [Sedimentisphaerales bacterium]
MSIIGQLYFKLITFLNSSSTKAKCVRGVTLLGVGTVFERFLRLVARMILARLLLKEDFGLWGIILAISTVCEAITEVGIKQSIIQNKKGDKFAYMNVAWWFQTLRGMGLFLLAYALAPVICGFYFDDKPEMLDLYNKKELILLIRISFLAIAFNGIMSPGAHVLRKNFQFGRLMLIMQGSALMGTVITLIYAYTISCNIWALVIGFSVEAVIRCVLSFIICPFMPSLHCERQSFNELITFARRMLGMPVLTMIAMELDGIILGKLVAPAMFGMYSQAKFLAQIPRQLFSKVINPVLLPAFSAKQDDKAALCKGLIIMTRTTAIISFPVAVFVLTCSKEILSIAFGPDYASINIAFDLLFLYILVRTKSFYFVSILLSLGLPNYVRRFVGLRALLTLLLIYPAIKYFSIEGAAGVLLVANLITLLSQVIQMRTLIALTFSEYLSAFIAGVFSSIFVIVAAILIFLFDWSPLINTIALGFICFLACCAGLYSIRRKM